MLCYVTLCYVMLYAGHLGLLLYHTTLCYTILYDTIDDYRLLIKIIHLYIHIYIYTYIPINSNSRNTKTGELCDLPQPLLEPRYPRSPLEDSHE